jgi:UPF0716 protein FxsA
MFTLLILVFVVLPIVEITLLVKLAGGIGWLPTIALVLGAGMAGAAIARVEGFRAAMRVRSQVARGVLPADEMFDGLLVAVAGGLLVLPGILSDVLGIVLLVRPTRRLVRQGLARWARKRFQVHVVRGHDAEGVIPRGDQIIDARVVETRVIE